MPVGIVHATPGFKMVIVIPRDLNQSPGKMASQAAHAAMVAGLKAQTFEGFVPWLLGGMKKIVLETQTQAHLGVLEEAAQRLGLVTHLVCDEGYTEVEFGSATALAIGPASEKAIDTVTGHLDLYGYAEKKETLRALGLLPTAKAPSVKPKRKRTRGKRK